MTEQPGEQHAETPGAEETHPAPATGVAEVDAVLADVLALAGRPVEEHVAVFEDAHTRLRRALDAPPHADTPPDAEAGAAPSAAPGPDAG